MIITGAVTGSIHTPSMSPHLPITPEEIVDAAIGATEAGAAVGPAVEGVRTVVQNSVALSRLEQAGTPRSDNMTLLAHAFRALAEPY